MMRSMFDLLDPLENISITQADIGNFIISFFSFFRRAFLLICLIVSDGCLHEQLQRQFVVFENNLMMFFERECSWVINWRSVTIFSEGSFFN